MPSKRILWILLIAVIAATVTSTFYSPEILDTQPTTEVNPAEDPYGFNTYFEENKDEIFEYITNACNSLAPWLKDEIKSTDVRFDPKQNPSVATAIIKPSDSYSEKAKSFVVTWTFQTKEPMAVDFTCQPNY